MLWEYKVESVETDLKDNKIEELLNRYGEQGFGLIQAVYSQTPNGLGIDHFITFIFERAKDARSES